MISSQLIRAYMKDQYRTCEQSTYVRYQAQIVDFVNFYLNEKIQPVKAIGIKKTVKRLQFPATSIKLVHRYLLSYYQEQKSMPRTRETK